MSDSLSMAFLVLLESLSPTERAVFLLREVFGYDYAEIAEITGKSEPNCRQIFTRARHHIDEGKPRFDASREQRDEVARRFFDAAAGGDLNALLSCSRPDVVMIGDGGGKGRPCASRCTGRNGSPGSCSGCSAGRRRMGVYGVPALVNGQPGAVAYDAEGRVASVFALDIADGLVQTVRVRGQPRQAPPSRTDLGCTCGHRGTYPGGHGHRLHRGDRGRRGRRELRRHPGPAAARTAEQPGQAPARLRQGNRAHDRRVGAGHRVPHRHRPEMRRRTAGVHPALRRARHLHAGRDDQQPEGGERATESTVLGPFHMVDPPAGHWATASTSSGPARRAWSTAGSSRPTAPRYRAPNSTSGRPTTRASTTSSSPACSPRATAAACSPPSGRGLLVPHDRAEPLPDPDRRPGRHAADGDRTPPVPPGAHPFHRDRPRAPRADHAHFRGGQPVYRIGRGFAVKKSLINEFTPVDDPALAARYGLDRPVPDGDFRHRPAAGRGRPSVRSRHSFRPNGP